jgi:DNA-directed RNA polymerase specialized sigma24 family protein
METLTANKAESISLFYEAWYASSFLRVAKLIRKRGGSVEDAKDVFHDALVIYYEKVQQPDFVLLSNEEAYLIGIVKHLWSRRITTDLRSQSFVDQENAFMEKPVEVDSSRLYKLVLSAGKKCLDLLSLFYIERRSMTEIAETFGFASEHSAAVQKFKCIEKIRETIKHHSLQHEEFLD